MNDRIKLVADFLYSSNSSKTVPLRISIVSGMFSGCDLTREEFIELMDILNNSINLKNDLNVFGKRLFSRGEI